MENTVKSVYLAPSMMVYKIKVEQSILAGSGRDYVGEKEQNW